MKECFKLNAVSKRFGNKTALDWVNLNVDENETVALIGPSGSGKTTLLRMIAGLEKPDEGTIIFPECKPEIGIVFQDFNLWPQKTVLENVIEAPMLVKKTPRGKAVKNSGLQSQGRWP